MCNPEAAPNRDNALNIYVERNDLFSSLDIKRKSGSSKKDLKNFRDMMLSEKSLEDNIVANISFLDSILKRRLEIIGRQYATKVGPIDILAKDRDTGKYVVIELKKGRSADRVYGQISRYMGWVRKNLAGGLTVDGVIVGSSIDEKLKSAVDAHDTDISLVVFDSKISGKKI